MVDNKILPKVEDILSVSSELLLKDPNKYTDQDILLIDTLSVNAGSLYDDAMVNNCLLDIGSYIVNDTFRSLIFLDKGESISIKLKCILDILHKSKIVKSLDNIVIQKGFSEYDDPDDEDARRVLGAYIHDKDDGSSRIELYAEGIGDVIMQNIRKHGIDYFKDREYSPRGWTNLVILMIEHEYAHAYQAETYPELFFYNDNEDIREHVVLLLEADAELRSLKKSAPFIS